jgi:mRNA interferase MazF
MEGSIEHLIKGDVISVPFPFSDTSTTKKRPALVITESDNNNIIICPITSKPGRDYEIKLEDEDFRVGKLNLSPCYIRPNHSSLETPACRNNLDNKPTLISPS